MRQQRSIVRLYGDGLRTGAGGDPERIVDLGGWREAGDAALLRAGAGLGRIVDLGGWRESAEHALIASLQELRQFLLERLRVPFQHGVHRAQGPLAQRLAVHQR
ncbi:hypothetical protein ACLESO_31230, partial [Pyxidicoccus sp. 3LG]